MPTKSRKHNRQGRPVRTRSPEAQSNSEEISDARAETVRGIMKRNCESGERQD
jgi:hypothetical protein